MHGVSADVLDLHPEWREAAEASVDLSKLKKVELQFLAEERGLSEHGTKAELIERLER